MEVQKDQAGPQRKRSRVKLAKSNGEMFQGTLDSISIFPEEVWEMILNHVSSPDRLAVCRTNSQLDTAFGECKNEWLLDQVLPFLMKHFTQKGHLLKCRQVCKNWRRTVNSFLESEHPCRRFYQKDHPMEQISYHRPTIYSSLSRCGLKYLEFFPNTVHKFSSCPDPTEPLVGRAVSLQLTGLTGDQEIREFWAPARTFLELQGGALWHFRFCLFSQDFTAKLFYQILSECLKLLPNLRTLVIIMCTRRFPDMHFIDEELAEVLAANPIPILPRLHSLNMHCVPNVMQQHIMEHFSNQLKRLSIDMPDMMFVQLTSNLVEICVTEQGIENFLHRLYTINEQVTPRSSQKLTLDMRYCTRVSGLELMQVLMQYPQLKHFQLAVNHSDSHVYECEGGSSVVPGLEYFEIEGTRPDLFCLSTLLYKFPNLKYLHFRDTTRLTEDSEDSDDNEDSEDDTKQVSSSNDAKVGIQQYLYSNKLEESPVWDWLDQLQVLTFDIENRLLRRFCNREQVKYYRERMAP